MIKPGEVALWIVKRTLLWTLGAAAFGCFLELLLNGTAYFRPDIPLVMAVSVGALNLCGNVLALFLAWVFRK